jgi:quinoprotein glucose dehydrogenase
MRFHSMRTDMAILTVAILMAGCQGAMDEPERAPDRWTGWESYNGGRDSAQYSSLDQINRDNVSSLEVVWRFPSGDSVHRGGPIVIDEVMYVVANDGVAAIDAATGEERWFAPDSVAPYVRGLVYWENESGSDKRLLLVKDHFLQALDAVTGERIDSFGRDGGVDLRQGLRRDPETIPRIASMTPGRIFENLIILGSAMGDDAYSPAPGDIRAYDVLTGDLVWSFHTIPLPGEFGYDTWPPNAWKTVGAANAWSAMSLDEERGIIYVPTGAPSYHFHGANRVGDNLFANSLIALDAATGERLWHFQAVHHDIWDYDLAQAPKLLTVERAGQKIDAVALATKHGYLFVFDRVTGEPVFPIEERAVPQSDVPGERTSPTQPFPVTLPIFARLTLSEDDLSPYADPEARQALADRIMAARNEGLFTPPSFQGSVNSPGSRGGANFGNGAVVPDAGLFYLAVIESPTIPVLEKRQDYRGLNTAEIYATACASCHGDRGDGQPPLFPALAGVTERLTEEQFLAVVQRGRERMEAFRDLNGDQILSLMRYVDTLDEMTESGISEAISVEAVSSVVNETAELDERQYRSGYHHFFAEDGLLLGPPPWSTLAAYDLNEGTLLWQKPFGDVIQLAEKGITGTGSLFPTNSLTATAGGLLFSATNDRKLRAWDRDTGEVLWSADLPADPGGIPAVYAIQGRQFVVVAATKGESGPGVHHAYVAFALPEATSP